VLDLAAKGTYYLNCKTGQASISAIAFKGSEQKEEDKGGVSGQKSQSKAVCVAMKANFSHLF